MRNGFLPLLGLSLAFSAGGCPQGTSVQLVNEADSPVEIDLYYGDDQNTSKAFLEEFGEEFQTTLAAGEVVEFTRDCEELQAIFIEKAELNIVGGIGPETESDLFRDGSDFGCGDLLIFTIREDGLFSLDIDFNAQSGIGGLGDLGGLFDVLADAGDDDDDDDDDDFGDDLEDLFD